MVSTIKIITKEEVNLLIEKGILQNTKYGLVDQNMTPTGYYITRHRRYIEDKFADMAKKM